MDNRLGMRTYFIKLSYILQNLVIHAFQKILFPKKYNTSAQKILILRGGSLGDNICALPAFSTIRQNFPQAQIDILTNSRGAHLVSIQKLIAPHLVNDVFNLFSLSSHDKWDLFKRLKQNRYDLMIEIPENLTTLKIEVRNMLLGKLLGIPSGFGWQIASTRLYKKYQKGLVPLKQETQRLLSILKTNHLSLAPSNQYPLGFTIEDHEKVQPHLEYLGLTDKTQNIALIVGAKRQTNRWPIDHFQQVVHYLVDQQYNVLLVGGPADDTRAKQLVFSSKVYNFCGMFSPLESGLVLQHCHLTISNDTGPMHLSYAVGTPVIAIFSARDYPVKWFPPEDGKNIVFRNDTVACTPCFLEECPYDNLCLSTISPTQIINELKKRGIEKHG